jgi:AcrR family transcriptional regulator
VVRSKSVRGVAGDVGTTTRAVYSLYGSKEGLIAALAIHGFDLLREGVGRLPTTPAPDRDLVEAGMVFRRFVVEHPSLYRIAFQSNPSLLRAAPAVRAAARTALDVLKQRIARLEDAGLLDGCDVEEATIHFDAICEGLAELELRGAIRPDTGEQLWRQGLTVLVQGLAGRPARPGTQ